MFDTKTPTVTELRTEEDVIALERLLRASERSRALIVMAFACEPKAAPVPPSALCAQYGFDVAYIRDCSLVRSLSTRLGSRHRLQMNESHLFKSGGSVMDEDYQSWNVYCSEDKPELYKSYLDRAARAMADSERYTAKQKENQSVRLATDNAETTISINPFSLAAGAVTPVSDEAEVRALANLVNDDVRDYPVVVVSQRFDGSPTALDLKNLASALDGFAHVAVLTSANLSWSFNSLVYLPVYNGAARLYPADAAALDTETAERYLYHAPGVYEGKRTQTRITSDAIGCAIKAHKSSVGIAEEQHETITVKGVLPDAMRAVCWEPKCIIATQELAEVLGLSDLPVERAFKNGMVLHGSIDPKTRFLRGYTKGALNPSEKALAPYVAGSTVLARVANVTDDACEVDLFPGVRVRIEATDVLDEATSPARVLTKGQVVSAYVVEQGQGDDSWLLSIREAEEDILPAPSLLIGGPSWLEPVDISNVEYLEDILEQTYGAEAALAAAEAPVPADAGVQAEIAIRQLYAQAKVYEIENKKLGEEALEAKRGLERAKRDQLSRGKRKKGEQRYQAPNGIAFADDDDQRGFEELDMNHRVQMAWYEQTVPAERKTLPLPGTWGYGKDFFATLTKTDVQLSKVLRCMVDVLLNRKLDLRQTHQLRTGAGGDAPARKLEDGSNVFRCYIEHKTPQAARLHFSRAADGTVTFHSVRPHDDMRL